MVKGLQVLYESPAGTTIAADVILVHGLGGNSITTWSDSNVCWPRDLLKEDIQSLRVLSNDYDSSVIKAIESSSRTSVAGHAESLLNEIVRKRRHLKGSEESRPIIFVCHSLGGLVVKQALIRSSEYFYNKQPHHASMGAVLQSTLGVIFLGTPHRGSGKATLGKLAAKAAKVFGATEKLLDMLEKDSDILEQQRNSFDSIRRDLFVACLYEERPMPILGIIVPEASACIDGPDVLKEQIPGEDHRSMAKFASRSEKGYEIIIDYIQRCLESAPMRPLQQSWQPRDPSIAVLADICMLESFKFAEFDDRYRGITRAHRSVVDAHRSTFDWIFSDSGPGFPNWLRQDKGIFWINGKAGAGKSTLMKFLFEDARLRQHLCEKEVDIRLLMAEFFFWSSGSYEQKSQIGLLKTILYRIFHADRDLMRTVYAQEWDAVYDMAEGLKRQSTANATKSRSLEALSRPRKLQAELMQAARLTWVRPDLLRGLKATLRAAGDTSKVFLLIDGLDEYEGTEEELEDLIEILKECVTFPNVKICVSSRPWTVFERHFGGNSTTSFRLQDLTSRDISLFVLETFGKSGLMQTLRQANPTSMPDFYSSIVQKAEGVFLWVHLVVKSIIKGLQNGDELSDIQKRVDELPADLESLYKHMLDRIPERYWERSSRMFSIVHDSRGPPSALTLWYAGERDYELPEQIEESTKLARCYQVYLRLMSQCAGLLEMRSTIEEHRAPIDDECPDLMRPYETWTFSSKQHYIRSNVHYLHRTTKDFLDTPKIAALIHNRVGQSTFDSDSWLAAHAAADLHETAHRVLRSGGLSEDDFWEMYGFEFSRRAQTLAFYLGCSRNSDVKTRLSPLKASHEKSIALLNSEGWLSHELREILQSIDS